MKASYICSGIIAVCTNKMYSFFYFGSLLGTILFGSNSHTAQAADENRDITGAAIVFGTSVPLTGHASHLGHAVIAGMTSYFIHINNMGGVFGHPIELIVYDDAYNPPLMISNVRRLIVEDKVSALIGLVGTPTTLSVVHMSRKYKIPLLFPFTGAIELRRPPEKYIFNLRPGYREESAESVDFFIKKGRKRFAVFYQNDAYGLNGLNGVKRRLIKYDLDPVAVTSFTRGVVDVKGKLQEIKRYSPDVVFLIGTAEVCAAFIHEAMNNGMDTVWFSIVSFVDVDELNKKIAGSKAVVYATDVFPPVSDTTYPAVREHLDLMKQYYPEMPPGQVSFEGYLNARVLVEALQNAGETFKEQNLISILENISEMNVGIGEPVTFSQTDRQGLERVFFIKVDNDKVVSVQK